jgi:hypothetical protein
MKPLVDYDGVLTKEERKRILSRIDSMFSWVGASIPDTVEIKGKKLPLRRAINDLIMKDELDDDDVKRIGRMVKALESHGRELREVIRKGDIDEDRAVEIYDEIKGILRAVSKLRRLKAGEDDDDDENYDKSVLMDRVDDEKRWQKYLKSVR